MKHCVLAAAGKDNTDANPDNIFLLSKTQNYMSPQSHYQQKINKNYQNFLVKGLKDQCIGMNIKRKVRQKIN